MIFARWPLLFLLLVPVALMVWQFWRPDRRLVLPYDTTSRHRGTAMKVVLDLLGCLPALMLAVAICLLAGPQRYGEPKDKRLLTNIEICLDISGSMTASFGEGSRYDAAVKALDEFLTYRKGDAFGLTFFGNSYLHWCPLTNDVSAVRCSAPFMRPENVPNWFGGTEIARALRACMKVLVERESGDRMILLITDGFSSDLQGQDAALVKELKEANITVFTVLIGEDFVQDEIYNIVTSTGGAAFNVGDPATATTVFKRIDEMKQAKLEKTLAEALDFFTPFCIVGLTCLGVSTLAGLGLRYTPW